MHRVRFVTHMDRLAVHKGALALYCRKELAQLRQVYHRDKRLTLEMKRNRNTPERDSAAKIHRAIDRVDNPTVTRIRAFNNSSLFSTNRMFRKRLAQAFNNQLFACNISAGYHIFFGLVLDIAQVLLNFKTKSACFFSKRFSDFQKIIILHFVLYKRSNGNQC